MITPDQLAVAIEAQKKTKDRLEKALIHLGFISEENLIKTLAHQLEKSPLFDPGSRMTTFSP